MVIENNLLKGGRSRGNIIEDTLEDDEEELPVKKEQNPQSNKAPDWNTQGGSNESENNLAGDDAAKSKKRRKLKKQRSSSDSEDEEDKLAAAAAAAAEREAREDMKKKKAITSALEALDVCLSISKNMVKAVVSGMSGGTEKGEEEIRKAISRGSCTFIYSFADLGHFSIAQKFQNLKCYQQCGVHWLSLLHSVPNANGILADEMGLGKTAQACVFLSYLYNIESSEVDRDFINRLKVESMGGKRSSLILVPSSVLDNWCKEIRRWAPNLKNHIVKYHGPPTVRFKIACDVLDDVRKGSFVILVSTIATVSSKEDVRLLRGLKEFEYMMVDEAHALKNSETIAYRRLNGSFNIRHRLLLTGTPVQNSQSELGNLLQFAMPESFDQSKVTKAIDYLITHYEEAVAEFPSLADLVEPWEVEGFKKASIPPQPARIPKPRGRKPKKAVEPTPEISKNLANLTNALNVKEQPNAAKDDTAAETQQAPVKKENDLQVMKLDRDDCSPIKRSHGKSTLTNASSSEDCRVKPTTEDSSNEVRPVKLETEDPEAGPKQANGTDISPKKESVEPIVEAEAPAPAVAPIEPVGDLPDEKDASIEPSIRVLQRLIAPFIIRRRKRTVMHELPKKTTYVIKCKMTGIQHDLYMKEVETKVEQNKDILVNKYKVPESEVISICTGHSKDDELSRRDDFFVKSLVFRMRRICNHPLLVPGSFYKEELLQKLIKYYATKVAGFKENPFDRVEKEIRGWSDFELHRSLQSLLSVEPRLERYLIPKEEFMKSAKIIELFKIIEKVREQRRKALVFSQFTMYLDMMEECLTLNNPNVVYLRLDGGYAATTRTDVVERFTTDDNVTLMLISTKAGGTGLNLTVASTVVLMDQDWNPHNDAQAEDRCHRIGQTQPVDVYKLLCEGSIEEYIMECCQRKLVLNDAFNGRASGEEEELTSN